MPWILKCSSAWLSFLFYNFLGDTVASWRCNVHFSTCPGPCTFSICRHLWQERNLNSRPMGGGAGAPCLMAQPFAKQNVPLHVLGDEMLGEGGHKGQVTWPSSVSSTYVLSVLEFRTRNLYVRVYQPMYGTLGSHELCQCVLSLRSHMGSFIRLIEGKLRLSYQEKDYLFFKKTLNLCFLPVFVRME